MGTFQQQLVHQTLLISHSKYSKQGSQGFELKITWHSSHKTARKQYNKLSSSVQTLHSVSVHVVIDDVLLTCATLTGPSVVHRSLEAHRHFLARLCFQSNLIRSQVTHDHRSSVDELQQPQRTSRRAHRKHRKWLPMGCRHAGAKDALMHKGERHMQLCMAALYSSLECQI